MCGLIVMFIFFFSSRRRHTRFDCDWSSDVCSSDLGKFGWRPNDWEDQILGEEMKAKGFAGWLRNIPKKAWALCVPYGRSEERRVGKECRSRWAPKHEKKKTRQRSSRRSNRRGTETQ